MFLLPAGRRGKGRLTWQTSAVGQAQQLSAVCPCLNRGPMASGYKQLGSRVVRLDWLLLPHPPHIYFYPRPTRHHSP